MVKKCCVNSCGSESFGGCGISFHRFPKNEDTYNKWLDVVPGKISASSVVCALHFKPEDFASHPVSSKKYLKSTAVPSIFKTISPASSIETMNSVYNGIEESNIKSYGYDVRHDTDYDSGDTDYVLLYNSYDEHDNSQLQDSGGDYYVQRSKSTVNIFRCKCCLDTGGLKRMWQEPYTGQQCDYGTMLIECFALPWHRPEDPKSNEEQICETCIRRLKDAVSFKIEVLASEQLLSKELDAGDTHDDEDIQYDVKTEYLHYEYLEDNVEGEECHGDRWGDGGGVGDNGDGDNDPPDHYDEVNEDGYDIGTQDDNSLACNNETEEYTVKQARVIRRRRNNTADDLDGIAVDAVPVSPDTKRFRGSDVVNLSTTELDVEPFEKQRSRNTTNKRIKGYLEDFLRYSNATPVGRHTTKGFQCCFCRDHYDSPKHLKRHTLDKHAEKVTVNSELDHVKLDITDLKCLDCSASVDTLQDFVNHMQNEHMMEMRKGMHYPIVPFKFDSHDSMACALCLKKFSNFDSLEKHMKVHLGYRDECYVTKQGAVFPVNYENGDGYSNSEDSCEDLKERVHEHGEVAFEDNIDENKLECILCSRTYESRTALLLHQNKYHLKLPVKCDYCDCKFLETKDLTSHVLMKHNDKTKKNKTKSDTYVWSSSIGRKTK